MDRVEKLNVELPEDLAKMVKSHVESGEYESASEVVCDALREMAERDAEHEQRLKEIIASIEKAAANPVRYTDAEVAELLRQQHERLMKALESDA